VLDKCVINLKKFGSGHKRSQIKVISNSDISSELNIIFQINSVIRQTTFVISNTMFVLEITNAHQLSFPVHHSFCQICLFMQINMETN